METKFSIPNGMKPEVVADIFAAYLLADRAFHYNELKSGRPPFAKNGTPQRWQLDTSNDFFLSISEDGKSGELSCRYDNETQKKVVGALIELFTLRYNPKR